MTRMQLADLAAIEAASNIVYRSFEPTPQYRWSLLGEALGADVWVKHENRAPTGAFKVRGGLVWFDALAQRPVRPAGVVTATRGNHGQSIGFAARQHGVPAVVVVPVGNSVSKNQAMRELGVELVEAGNDFQAAREQARVLAALRGLEMVPSFDPLLVAGVATYSLEFMREVTALDVLYVPIGLGSGICGAVAARDALGLNTQIVGVVSAHAPAYSLSFQARRAVTHPTTTRVCDGMACSTPEAAALEIICRGVDRIVEISDDEARAAIRLMYECTHHRAEGAGAAGLAAAFQERERIRGKTVGLVVSGGNIDDDLYTACLR